MSGEWSSAAGKGVLRSDADMEREGIAELPTGIVRAQLERLLSAHVSGVEIAEVGYLHERRGNHPAGGVYAVLRAANCAAAALACDALAAVAGVSIEHWLHGWRSVPGDQALTIVIYPEIAALRERVGVSDRHSHGRGVKQ